MSVVRELRLVVATNRIPRSGILMNIKYLATTLLMLASLLASNSQSQAQTNNSNQGLTVGDGAFNNAANQSNTNQNNNLSNGGLSNNQQFNYPSIPIVPVIQNPINTENDFGFNFGGAANTLQGNNMTFYVGITYQPGRTDDHNARMAKLKSETALLESQKYAAQTQLQLLKQQVAEQELRLQRMRSRDQTPTK
jgi:hypothetical protein